MEQAIIDEFKAITDQFEKINERFDSLEDRFDKLESRVDQQGKLLMILVSDAVRDQIRKDDLYPFATDEQKVETAVSRIIERQNGLSKMILDQLEK